VSKVFVEAVALVCCIWCAHVHECFFPKKLGKKRMHACEQVGRVQCSHLVCGRKVPVHFCIFFNADASVTFQNVFASSDGST
jgi:hypothetical protein